MNFRIIGGQFKGRPLKAPKATSTRPTQGMLREAVFNICQNEIEGARFLDLFAGSGAMGLEAVSRGASHAALVEKNRQATACIKENIHSLQIESLAEIFPMNAEKAISVLQKQGSHFDIVYIDPPYDTKDTPVKNLLDAILPLLNPGAIVFVEERHSLKAVSAPYESPSLLLKDSRRFGIALLHQYRFRDKETL